MKDKLKQLSAWASQAGIPVPLLRDYKTGSASITFTMLVVSFTLSALGLISKAAGFLGGIDLSQSMVLLGITSSLYLGRRIGNDSPPTPPAA